VVWRDFVGGSAQLITAARADWKPVEKVSEDDEPDAILLESWVPAKLRQVEEVDTQAEQADWIRRYMAQQDEEDDINSAEGENGDDSDWEVRFSPLASSTVSLG
jgi:hypothetical protein